MYIRFAVVSAMRDTGSMAVTVLVSITGDYLQPKSSSGRHGILDILVSKIYASFFCITILFKLKIRNRYIVVMFYC